MTHRLRAVVIKVALLFASLLFSLIILEVLIRFSGLRPLDRPSHLHQASTGSGILYELRPSIRERGFNTEIVTTDSRGFRSQEIISGKPVLAFLGDSFAFGFGVEDHETNPAAVQRLLPEYAVVNTGVNGYNIEQETLTYERKVDSLHPAAVILEFVYNDADRHSSDIDNVARVGGADGAWQYGDSPVFVLNLLRRHSALFRLMAYRLSPLSSSRVGLLGAEWTDGQVLYYETWFLRLDHAIGDRPKLIVLWPSGWLHPRTQMRIIDLAMSHGWNVLDIGSLTGTRFKRLSWDSHPAASVHAEAGEVIASYLSEYLLP